TFGKGCSGSSKYLPVLGPDPVLNSAPVIGGAFTLLNEGLPPAQLVLLSFGASNNTWGGLSLPFSLAPLGMTGCDLLVSLDILVTGARSNGAGRVWWTMPIPDDPKLLGIVFYNQSAVVAPGANPGGLLWSNGGEGTIGVR
ncbi:MAG: hypothetical protein VX951_12075, partial [Planctomycetota bacterium]|nr:hypothetical protein [Planctomycetota bacterium]